MSSSSDRSASWFWRSWAIAAVTAVVLVGAGCSDDNEPQGSDTTQTSEQAVTSTTAPTPDTGEATTSTEPPAPEPPPETLGLTEVAEASEPTAIAFRAGTDLAYVTEREGTVRIFGTGTDGTWESRGVALDVSDRLETGFTEQGLLGIAIDESGQTAVVNYTEAAGRDRARTVVERYDFAGDEFDLDSGEVLLTQDQPFRNHNGGHVVFGPDGALYVGFGDGGRQGDPQDNGQDPGTVLAKIVRIADVHAPGAPEIWVTGVRNPWRFEFDPANGDLWVADVGGNQLEEVSHLAAGASGVGGGGANLGWSLREGTLTTGKPGDQSGLIDPVYEYDHSDGSCSITGGPVYRGSAIPGLDGAYLFSDFCVATIRALVPADDGSRMLVVYDPGATAVSSFGVDSDGEVYVVSLDGSISRLSA